jgi:hypothetical protein
MPAKKATEFMDEAAERLASLDRAFKDNAGEVAAIMAKDPSKAGTADRDKLIAHARQERTIWEIKERKKADRKAAKEEDD